VARAAEAHGFVGEDPPDPSYGLKQRRLVPAGKPGDPGARGEEEVADEEATAETDADAVVRVPGGVVDRNYIPGTERDPLPVKDDAAIRPQGLAVAGGKKGETDRERLDLPPHEIRNRPGRIAGLERPGALLLYGDAEVRERPEPPVPDGLVAVVGVAVGEEEEDRPRGFPEEIFHERHDPVHLPGLSSGIDEQDLAGCPDEVGVRTGDVRFPEEGVDLGAGGSRHRLPLLVFEHCLHPVRRIVTIVAPQGRKNRRVFPGRKDVRPDDGARVVSYPTVREGEVR